MLENEDIGFEKLAPDRDRKKKAQEVQEFLKRLTMVQQAPLRDVVEKLNGLDFRGEAQKVQTFIQDASRIYDVLDRVIVNG